MFQRTNTAALTIGEKVAAPAAMTVQELGLTDNSSLTYKGTFVELLVITFLFPFTF